MGYSRAYAKQRGSFSTLLLAAPLIIAFANPAMIGDTARMMQDNMTVATSSMVPSIQSAALDFGTTVGSSIGHSSARGSAHFISGGPIFLPE